MQGNRTTEQMCFHSHVDAKIHGATLLLSLVACFFRQKTISSSSCVIVRLIVQKIRTVFGDCSLVNLIGSDLQNHRDPGTETRTTTPAQLFAKESS